MNKMAGQITELDSVINSLNEIKGDITVPRNVRTRIDSIIFTLREDLELSIKANKVLNELEEISSDFNLQAYTRAQMWNIISSLERLQR